MVFASTALALDATAEPANRNTDIVSKPDKRLFINTSITYTLKPNSKNLRSSVTDLDQSNRVASSKAYVSIGHSNQD
ncbi:hypothetical protein GCM10016272_05940 [Psychrobacter glaciei]|uniref:Uncharacterized protein n=1 Tax=Psychrobacter glaciei TaxID=619771 RepID=A0ABQ3GPN5_9GAMM|nr:hypothetical protein GCM10016272_05940 [Psychrobacter glaciei]